MDEIKGKTEATVSITNNQKSGELQVGFKDKNGKPISFTYGKILDDTMVDKETLERSIKGGLLSAYISKGWVLRGRVNIANKIIGSPVPFVGITLDEAGKAIEIKAKQIVPQTGDARPATEMPNITSTENTDKSIGDVVNGIAKKRGRPSKQSNLPQDNIPVSTTIQATPEGTMPPAVVVAETAKVEPVSIDDVPAAGDAAVQKPAVPMAEIKKEEDFV